MTKCISQQQLKRFSQNLMWNVSLRLLKISISKFQDGGQPPFFKSTYNNNFIIVIIIILTMMMQRLTRHVSVIRITNLMMMQN